MRSMHLPFGAIAVVALTLAFAATAQAQTVTIELTSLTTIAKPNDLAPKGKPNKGDSISFRDLLINRKPQFGKKKGKPIAYDVGTLTYTSATTTTMTVKAIFPGIGTITYGGNFNSDKKSNVLPITGATGGFKGAQGTITIGAGATTSPNTFVVTVPGHPLNINGNGGGVA
jgi:hypothetical protein